MPHTTHQPGPEPVSKPDYLTEKQWARLTLAILIGVNEGCEKAGKGRWSPDLGVTAVGAVRARLDVLMAQEDPPDA
ncbi:hypothetical protein FHS35_009238 [Streptomyces umbrinus]|uniref:hypothetical protein n=1 Tax=Streptomyces umbrinus TaxID=67370 RepID=UPI00167F0F24|nr:hypothetical protein [Streptomyces umbrinus]MCR3732320.1 hypothetical protein [Streptomyces umbrinus]GHH68082.1 hypothetical protein GCM10018775_92390 [Streptomyces umbrinus]